MPQAGVRSELCLILSLHSCFKRLQRLMGFSLPAQKFEGLPVVEKVLSVSIGTGDLAEEIIFLCVGTAGKKLGYEVSA